MVSGWLVSPALAAAASGLLQALWPALAIGSSGPAEFFVDLLFLLASAVFVVFGYFSRLRLISTSASANFCWSSAARLGGVFVSSLGSSACSFSSVPSGYFCRDSAIFAASRLIF